MTSQQLLFENDEKQAGIEDAVLFALGDFQSRKKVLAGRELPLDRLRGAFKRAAERYGRAEFDDELLAEALTKLGSKVVRVPNFVAKHPFRVTVPADVADRAREFYSQVSKHD
jgi:hypothetical protein